MSMTYEDLKSLANLAHKNPWEFFKTHTLKEMLSASHPDRLRMDSSALFASFSASHDRSLTQLELVGEYPLYNKVEIGDLREVYETKDDLVIKIPRVVSKSANKLVSKEADILTLLEQKAGTTSYRLYFPHVANSFTHKKKKVLVTSYNQKLYSGAHILAHSSGGIDARHIGWMTRRILSALGYLHINGYAHCAITPEHVLFAPTNHAGVLTGFIHAEKVGEKISIVPQTRRAWYGSHKNANFALDIQMLGSTMMEMAGELPKRFKNFLKGLAFVTSADAWQLEEDLGAILVDCYGPPKFVELASPNVY